MDFWASLSQMLEKGSVEAIGLPPVILKTFIGETSSKTETKSSGLNLKVQCAIVGDF